MYNILNIMKKKNYIVMPDTKKILEQMGSQIKLARLRRRITASNIAERANISRTTLNKIETGDPSVSMGAYANVLHALNSLDKDLLLIAKEDELGRTLQDLELVTPKRVRNK